MKPLTSRKPRVFVMVGLPARGKTFLARKMARYLGWMGFPTRVFNVGNYRRQLLGSQQPATFFDPGNPDGLAAREKMALAALADMFAWLDDGGEVAIYDATNAVKSRRDLLTAACRERGIEPIFVESVCNDAAIVERNIRATKLSMPDYAGMEPDAAVADFRARIAHYESAYEPMDEPDRSWVKLVDIGERIVLNRIRGFLPTRLVSFLSNLHLEPRPIYLTRHGQSQYNHVGRIGGDSSLTDAGRAYASRLQAFLTDELAGADDPQVWTSTLRRTQETAEGLPYDTKALRYLDEIDAGICDGLTYEQIEARYPDDYAARKADKLRYRYPRGESYQDVIHRLDPVIIELERQRHPVVVVAHQAVLRCLYGYLTDQPPEQVPHLSIPLHTVIRLRPSTYGKDEERIVLS
jgi:broad specificity phosphatase PhoE/predicted kinase